jgi:CubicO group peptidase (beta-lactamase class C family)
VLVVSSAHGLQGVAGAHRAGRGAGNYGVVHVVSQPGNTTVNSGAASRLPALNAANENKITSGSVALDNVRAVLISVDGETKIVHYRHRFTAEDTTHVWSVTKTVVSTLIGIAISDGLIDSLEQTLAESLPQHRAAMSAGAEKVTLRQLMTMTGGFGDDPPYATVTKIFKS